MTKISGKAKERSRCFAAVQQVIMYAIYLNKYICMCVGVVGCNTY